MAAIGENNPPSTRTSTRKRGLQGSKVNKLRRPGETHIVQPRGIEATNGARADKGDMNRPSDSRYLHGRLTDYSSRGSSHECIGEGKHSEHTQKKTVDHCIARHSSPARHNNQGTSRGCSKPKRTPTAGWTYLTGSLPGGGGAPTPIASSRVASVQGMDWLGRIGANRVRISQKVPRLVFDAEVCEPGRRRSPGGKDAGATGGRERKKKRVSRAGETSVFSCVFLVGRNLME